MNYQQPVAEKIKISCERPPEPQSSQLVALPEEEDGSLNTAAEALPTNPTIHQSQYAHDSSGAGAMSAQQQQVFAYITTTWTQTRINQIINVLYFGPCAAFFFFNFNQVVYNYLTYVTLALILMTVASCFFFVKDRSFVSSRDELPHWCRAGLRIFAFSLPALAMYVVFTFPVTITEAYFWNDERPADLVIADESPVYSVSEESQALHDKELASAHKLYIKMDYRDALVHYEKALTYDKFSEPALLGAAASTFHYYPSKRIKIIDYSSRVLEINNNNLDAHYYLAKTLLQEKRFQEAIDHVERVCSEQPDYVPAWRALRDAQIGVKNYDAALNAADQHLLLHKNEWTALNDRIEVLKLMGRNTEAKKEEARLKSL